MVDSDVIDEDARQRIVEDLDDGILATTTNDDPRVAPRNAGDGGDVLRPQLHRQHAVVEGGVEVIAATDDDASPSLGRKQMTFRQRWIRRQAEQMERHVDARSGFVFLD